MTLYAVFDESGDSRLPNPTATIVDSIQKAETLASNIASDNRGSATVYEMIPLFSCSVKTVKEDFRPAQKPPVLKKPKISVAERHGLGNIKTGLKPKLHQTDVVKLRKELNAVNKIIKKGRTK